MISMKVDGSFTMTKAEDKQMNVENFMDLEFGEGEAQMMGRFDKLKEMPSFPEIFTHGGDEKLPLDPVKGHNIHFIKPYVDEEAIVRSSCTCSPPTQLGYDAA